MPDSQIILDSLHGIANDWRLLAVFWHGYVAVLLIALWSPLRVSRRAFAICSIPPAASVSALAWTAGNPFNALVFAALCGALLAASIRLPRSPPPAAHSIARSAGFIMLAFAWSYPHFLDVDTLWPYLYAAPLGLVPCPTLAAIVGMALITDGLASRGWAWLLAGTGAFYGLFGAVYLGVRMDWILFAGSIVLGIGALRTNPQNHATG